MEPQIGLILKITGSAVSALLVCGCVGGKGEHKANKDPVPSAPTSAAQVTASMKPTEVLSADKQFSTY
ncbi:MAG: hypothetical protein WBF71_02240, partial [Microthrixaceae bacterium]